MNCDQTMPKTATECAPCSGVARNRYFRGKRLTIPDYQAEQSYMIERRRLINRAMFGWGIVQGFDIRHDARVLTVGPGVALDSCGRELVACDALALAAPEDVLWLKRGDCGLEIGEPPKTPTDQAEEQANEARGGREYLLCAHYAEQPIDGVRIADDCGGARCEANHLCETVVYSLVPIDGCPPGLADCLHNPWDVRSCGESDFGWSAPQAQPDRPRIAAVHDRGTHRQLVDWSIQRLNDVNFCEPCRLERVGELRVDLDGCVPLACVAIGHHCGEAYIAQILAEARPKRLARPNDVLFDLIRGCDLVRIQDVGWRDWLEPGRRRVPFSDFAEMFVRPEQSTEVRRSRRGRGQRPPAGTNFWVCFSGPVQISSLTPDVFTMTLVQRDTNEAVGNVLRVPVVALAVADKAEGDPDGTTRAFHPMVSASFWEGEINPDATSGFESETLVELEVRTGFIVDYWFGQEVAGGGRFVPTSGCTPGGRFLSSFIVVPDEEVSNDSSQQAATPQAQEA